MITGMRAVLEAIISTVGAIRHIYMKMTYVLTRHLEQAVPQAQPRLLETRSVLHVLFL